MRAYIKYKGIKEDNYTRYGAPIPYLGAEIDICKHFKCSKERAVFIAKQLKSDSRIECKLYNETETVVKEVEAKTKNAPTNRQKLNTDIKDRFNNSIKVKK